MANERPTPPNIICPPTSSSTDFYSAQQSQLNTTRKDKFKLVIDVPNILKSLLKQENRYCHGGNLERLEMSIWGFVVPEMKIKVMEKPYSGQVLKFSELARPAFPAVNVNFTVDNRFDNYFILYKWLDIQNDESMSEFDAKNLNVDSRGHLSDYSSTFTIYALDEYESPTAKWDYSGAFPVSIGALNSTYRETTELETNFSFEFSQIKMSLL